MKFLITAGPTRENIDPVRYLSNRSSGKMGYALASAAVAAGHEVVLVSGPVHLPPPGGVKLIRVVSARDMYEAVAEHLPGVEVAVFSAAVADYRVAEPAGEKIKKREDELLLRLVKNPDILGSARGTMGYSGVLIGFAAETNDVVEHARKKLESKQCDLIVANDVSRTDIGFDGDDNEVIFVTRGGGMERVPKSPKTEIARRIIREAERLAAS